jgi:outer membrane protein assembly factor BamB
VAIADGVVYTASSALGRLLAFKVGCRTDGGVCLPLWTGQVGDSSSATPTVANGLVFTGGNPNNVVAFKVGCGSGGASCDPVWVGHTGVAVSSVAVANGVLYVTSNDAYLYAFSIDGKRPTVFPPRPKLGDLISR